MAAELEPNRSAQFGTIVLLVLASVLCVTMLTTVSFSAGGGDAAMGKALESFFFTVALWVVLAFLPVNSAVMGKTPRWVIVTGFLLLPLSGVAAFVAIDMCSRHIERAVIGPVLLPLLIAVYATVARFARLRAAVPGNGFDVAIWSVIAVLSVTLLLAAM
jgi:uncharacterized membrane protein YhdT